MPDLFGFDPQANRKPPVLCLFCDHEATRYCDFPLALASADLLELIRANPKMKVPSLTCDAPCCRAHVRQIGHVCGRRLHDTIDHCTHHATGKHPNPRRDLPLVAIEQERRRVHAEIRRMRMGVADTGNPV
jgi:hypothetical protein